MASRRPLVWVAIVVPAVAMVVGIYALFIYGVWGVRRKHRTAEQAQAAREEDAPFLYAKPRGRRMPLPERFGAPLPTSADDFQAYYHGDDERFPPSGHVMARLCAGDEEMLARFHAAVEKAARTEPAGELRRRFARMFDECDEPPCARLRARATETSLDGAIRGVYWLALAGCSEEPLATFEAEGVPPLAIFERFRYLTYEESRPPYWPRLASAVVELAADSDTQAHDMRTAVANLMDTGDPRAEDALLRADQAAVGFDLKQAIGLAALGARSAKVRALHRRACRVEPRDGACRDPDDPPDDGRYPPLATVKALVVDHTIEKTHARLVELGLIDASQRVDPADAAAAASDGRTFEAWEHGADQMIDARRGIWFDVETDTWPNHHDELLARLSRLVRPALEGAAFEELAPKPEDDETPYTLRAYMDGTRYELKAENKGDWYDMNAVLGFINALLRERRSELGCLTVHTGDQMAKVVCGKRAALRTAIAEGLLRPDGADEPTKSGKGFEDEVLRKLQGGEQGGEE